MNEEGKKEKNLASLEALLFIHGEPLAVKKVAKVLDLDEGGVLELLGQLKEELKSSKRGLDLIFDQEKVQLATKSAFGEILSQFIKEELSEDLTSASLETVSIITYLGPISKSKLEYFRGVNSFFTLRNLMMRGLIDRFPDPKKPNAYLYQPTFDLLRHLGLKEVKELPEYDHYQTLIKNFEVETPAQQNENAG